MPEKENAALIQLSALGTFKAGKNNIGSGKIHLKNQIQIVKSEDALSHSW